MARRRPAIPRLARIYDFLTAPLERGVLGRWRRRLWNAVPRTGSGLEVGAGTGANAAFYPAESFVVATDLSDAMLRRARPKLPANSALVAADAEALPFRDGTFDWCAETLVFCEVHDPVAGLAEVRRVLRPAAPLLMLEHVRPSGWLGRVADWLTRILAPLIGEHFDRDAEASARRARLETLRREWLWRDAVVLLELRAPPPVSGE